MWFLVGFLVLVLVEIVLLIQLGGAIGVWLALLWIVLTGAFGVILLKGVAMLGQGDMRYSTDAFRDSRNPMAHRGLVLIAGLLLLLPGPLTDTIGILLLFAPVRSAVIRLIARHVLATRAPSDFATIIDGDWQDVSDKHGQGGADGRGPKS